MRQVSEDNTGLWAQERQATMSRHSRVHRTTPIYWRGWTTTSACSPMIGNSNWEGCCHPRNEHCTPRPSSTYPTEKEVNTCSLLTIASISFMVLLLLMSTYITAEDIQHIRPCAYMSTRASLYLPLMSSMHTERKPICISALVAHSWRVSHEAYPPLFSDRIADLLPPWKLNM